MAARDDYLVDTLAEMGVVTDEELALAQDESMSSGEGVVDTLIAKGVVMPIQVSQAKAAQFGTEFIELGEQTIEDDVVSAVPRNVAHQYKVVPLYMDELSVTVAMADPSDLDAIDGLGQALAGNKVVDISRAIQGTAEANGYSIVREFVGHGVGKKVHEDPQIPNFDDGGRRSPVLKPGMTLAIEPMVNLGQRHVEMLEDGWTVVARDGLPSAHFEHTILVTDGEPEILTCPDNLPSSPEVS
ncbi:MAG: M24 family metallopeptidase [Limisphaerales bacterium]